MAGGSKGGDSQHQAPDTSRWSNTPASSCSNRIKSKTIRGGGQPKLGESPIQVTVILASLCRAYYVPSTVPSTFHVLNH